MSIHQIMFLFFSVLILSITGVNNAAPVHGAAHRHPAHRPNMAVIRPAIGVRVRVLPVGWRPLIVAGTTYYVVDNVYYQRKGETYLVVQPPAVVAVPVHTASVSLTEDSYTTIYVKGKDYYYRNGVFYDKTSDGQYQRVPAPAGAM